MASGYPPQSKTEEDKKRYIEMIKRQEGMEIDPTKIEHNPGLRSICKLSLNCEYEKKNDASTAATFNILNNQYSFRFQAYGVNTDKKKTWAKRSI